MKAITGLKLIAVNIYASIQLIALMSKTYTSFSFVLLLALAIFLAILLPLGAGAQNEPVNVWWPKSGSHVTGSQPFKAQVPGLAISDYEMFWQVDGGSWVWMDNNSSDSPHKEALVEVGNWNWKGAGPYKVNFIARQNGTVISEQSVDIYIDNGQPIVVAQTASQSQIVAKQATPQPQVILTSTKSISSDTTLYVDSDSPAAKQADMWQSSNPTGANAMRTLAAEGTAKWFGGWSGDIYSAVRSVVEKAAAKGATPVMVAYNIPARDCGGYSQGGVNSVDGYKSWINSFASAIGSAQAIVILEPDALAQLNCLSDADKNTRLSLLSSAVSALKVNSNTKVYIDAGHSGWIDANTMANSLKQANVASADGFALNVSNFDSNSNSISYGQQISSNLGGKHFVVDTSRNGNGSSGEWCNPSGRKIGTKPTLATGNSLVDAYLWVKTPGESDGNCNGGPSAGVWWPEYAQSLVN